MLRSLQVRNYILIDSLDVEFPEGLVIISGQTGAGKSILLGALSLTLGAKADASVIGPSSDTCVVEATFDVAGNGTALRILQEGGFEPDGDQVIIRRVVSRSGRSRSFVCDEPASASFLKDLSEVLLDIHGQHQTLYLSSDAFRLSLLDACAGDSAILGKASAAWEAYTSLDRRYRALSDELAALKERSSFYSQWAEELVKAAPYPGEWEELDELQRRLANAEELESQLYGAKDVLESSDSHAGVSELLKEAAKSVRSASRYLPDAAPLADRLESARVEIDDVTSEVDRLAEGLAHSPGKLEEVEDRMSLLSSLMKKHSVSSVDELIALKDRFSAGMTSLSDLEEELHEVSISLDKARRDMDSAAEELHSARSAACAGFGSKVTAVLHGLELDNSEFSVSLERIPMCRSGFDRVRFLFTSSPSIPPADLASCSSGGEMSRVMLALKSVCAAYTGMPALVFDEIDSGVSGSAADKMGRLICSMSSSMQVIAITHLPQVAAKGGTHFLVSRTVGDGGRDVTTLSRLDYGQRVSEIARMLSGDTITPEAVSNAKVLLK